MTLLSMSSRSSVDTERPPGVWDVMGLIPVWDKTGIAMHPAASDIIFSAMVSHASNLPQSVAAFDGSPRFLLPYM